MSTESNPYAAPQASTDLAQSSAVAQSSGPQPWEVGEVLSASWAIFKAQWPVLLGAIVVGYVVLLGAQLIVGGVLGAVLGQVPGAIVAMIISIAVTAFVNIGWMRIFLAAARGQTPEFGALFSGADRVLPMFIASLVTFVGVALGMILLIVPGLIVALGLILGQVLVADTNMEPINALKASWDLTNGQKGKIFVMFLAILGLNIAGAIACGVGMLATIPMSFVAFATVYVRITGRMAPEAGAAGA